MTLSIPARINAILASQGEPTTYRRVTGVAFSETTLANSPTYTEYAVAAHARKYSAKEISGLIRDGDREMRIASDAISFIPEENDIVLLGGDTYKVVSVDRRTANGEDALYILTIRGGH